MKRIMLPVLCTVWGFLAFGQPSERINEKLHYENETAIKELKFEVRGSSKVLTMAFEGKITSGSIEIEVIDPDGEEQNGFELSTTRQSKSGYSVSSSTGKNIVEVYSGAEGSGASVIVSKNSGSGKNSNSNSNSNDGSSRTTAESYEVSDSGNSTAKGVLSETIASPKPGIWTILIDSENVTGDISFKVKQN